MRALVLSLALFAAGAAQADEPRFDTARVAIEQQVATGRVASIAVAVAQKGRILWQQGFGWADRARRLRATEHTPYSLASVTKVITAVDLMLLVDRGRIDLDRPVNDYLGAAKLVARVGNVDDATVRRVANHTSGLPLHYNFFYADEHRALPSMDDTIRRYGQLLTAPGEMYLYSNLGYGVLSDVVGRVAGTSYADFTRDALFKPLGMTRSWIGRAPAGLTAAVRYAPDGRAVPDYAFDHDGASAAFASANDLVRFGIACLDGPILSEAAREEMFRGTAETNVAGLRRGVGWGIKTIGGVETYAHNGAMPGVTTTLLLLPGEDAAIVVLANGEAASAVQEIADKIVTALVPGEAQRRVATLRGTWRGAIDLGARSVGVVLDVDGTSVSARVGDAAPERVDAQIDGDGMLLLKPVAGDLGPGIHPYRLQLRLKPRGDVLNGAATAIDLPMAGRSGNAISYWIELKRAETE